MCTLQYQKSIKIIYLYILEGAVPDTNQRKGHLVLLPWVPVQRLSCRLAKLARCPSCPALQVMVLSISFRSSILQQVAAKFIQFIQSNGQCSKAFDLYSAISSTRYSCSELPFMTREETEGRAPSSLLSDLLELACESSSGRLIDHRPGKADLILQPGQK